MEVTALFVTKLMATSTSDEKHQINLNFRFILLFKMLFHL